MKILTVPAGPVHRDISESLSLKVRQQTEHLNLICTKLTQERDAAKQQVQVAVTIIQECRECLFGDLDATDDLRDTMDVFVQGNKA